ncbi:hypothetical protein GCM10020218_002300 [Dactylosporangium vinaceum]
MAAEGLRYTVEELSAPMVPCALRNEAPHVARYIRAHQTEVLTGARRSAAGAPRTTTTAIVRRLEAIKSLQRQV